MGTQKQLPAKHFKWALPLFFLSSNFQYALAANPQELALAADKIEQAVKLEQRAAALEADSKQLNELAQEVSRFAIILSNSNSSSEESKKALEALKKVIQTSESVSQTTSAKLSGEASSSAGALSIELGSIKSIVEGISSDPSPQSITTIAANLFNWMTGADETRKSQTLAALQDFSRQASLSAAGQSAIAANTNQIAADLRTEAQRLAQNNPNQPPQNPNENENANEAPTAAGGGGDGGGGTGGGAGKAASAGGKLELTSWTAAAFAAPAGIFAATSNGVASLGAALGSQASQLKEVYGRTSAMFAKGYGTVAVSAPVPRPSFLQSESTSENKTALAQIPTTNQKLVKSATAASKVTGTALTAPKIETVATGSSKTSKQKATVISSDTQTTADYYASRTPASEAESTMGTLGLTRQAPYSITTGHKQK